MCSKRIPGGYELGPAFCGRSLVGVLCWLCPYREQSQGYPRFPGEGWASKLIAGAIPGNFIGEILKPEDNSQALNFSMKVNPDELGMVGCARKTQRFQAVMASSNMLIK